MTSEPPKSPPQNQAEAPSDAEMLGASVAHGDPLYAEQVKNAVAARLFGKPVPPLRVGRFEVEGRLGAGGMSVVYTARDPELGRTVALKLLQDGARGERLLREARALARLRHPHVVTVYEVGNHREHLFLALEHVEGLPLGAWLAAAPRTVDEVVKVMRGVADGLAAVHDLGLVHRDVKPDNIVVDARGTARLVDFGLVVESGDAPTRGAAAALPTGDALTRPGATPGTPRYIAPERKAGGASTPASDQFSFGVTLEEALSGLSAPDRILRVARRAAASDPKDRFADLHAVRDALASPRAGLGGWIAGAVLVSIIGGAVALTRGPADPCDAAAAPIRETWSDEARALVEAALPDGDPALLSLDRYAARWGQAARDRCSETLGGAVPTEEVRADRDACFEVRRSALGDLVRALSTGDASSVAAASDLAAELPPISDCEPALDRGGEGDPPNYVALVAGTTREDARAAARTGLRGLRDGALERAFPPFEEAVRLDPTYGAAHLWLAILYSHGDVGAARPHLRRAFDHRAGMSPEARTLLAALTPCIQADPIDDRVCEERLLAAAQRSPRSAHLWFELARHRWNRTGSSPEVIEAFDRALEADPRFALALFSQGQALAYLGREDEALATIERCLAVVPGATTCLRDRVWIRAARGECEAVEADARSWRALAPEDAHPLNYLASGALARGEPMSVVGELFEQIASRFPEPTRTTLRLRNAVLLAIASGDFPAARAALGPYEARLLDSSARSTRLLPIRLGIMIALEVGEPEEAARLAADALERSPAWTPDPRNEDFAIARDFGPTLLDVLRDTGHLGDAERSARRGAWLDAWRSRTSPANVPFLWLAAYGRTVHDAAEAEEAFAAERELGSPPFHPLAYTDGPLGRAYLAAGRPADALPYLERASRSCHAIEPEEGLELPWETVRAARELGRAREALGDVAGACEAYALVLARWGSAVPRSVTAEAARARSAALACP